MHTQALTDEGLVRSVLGGDESAFTLLYERYRRPIYSTAYRIMRNSEDAQDAAQEIAFKLYRSLHLWDVQRSNLSSWIYKMAVNHSIDCHRARCRRAELPLPEGGSGLLQHAGTSGDSSPSPLHAVLCKENLETILQCAGSLPEIQRKIFIHRYVHDRKLEEIARIERCRLGTVKSSLHRATETVRRLFRKTGLWSRRDISRRQN